MREIDAMDSFHWKPWLTKQITDEEFNFGVRAAFLRFFCFLMQDYRKYTLYIRMFAKPVVELDRRRFLKGGNENPFTRVFTLTQTFLTFLGFTQNGHVKISLMIFLTNGTHTHMF